MIRNFLKFTGPEFETVFVNKYSIASFISDPKESLSKLIMQSAGGFKTIVVRENPKEFLKLMEDSENV